jgi:hypothetical protein
MPNCLSLEVTYQHKSAVVETRYRSSDNQETLKMSLGNESKSPAGI